MPTPETSLRLVFAGTPQFAAGHLQALVQARHHLGATYTQPDRRAGRGKKLVASPVKLLAEDNAVPVYQPASLKTADSQAQLRALAPDLLIVVAYGLILPEAVLAIPRFGCINVHASLLPRWRGAAPIQRAIEAGDQETGITIMQMDAGLDTGPMLAQARLPITENCSSGRLHDQLLELGPPLLLQVLDSLHSRQEAAVPQPAGATYAHKIEKADALLDWELDAAQLQRKVLAFNPTPTAWIRLGADPVKVWEAEPCKGNGAAGEILSSDRDGLVVACGTGALRLTRLQLPGGKPLQFEQILNAHRDRFVAGKRLGD